MIGVCVISDPWTTSFVWDSGLIDEGESAEITALRELKEETGFKGEVVGVTPGIVAYTIYLWLRLSIPSCAPLSSCSGGVRECHPETDALFMWMTVTCLDPGLSNCTTQIVLVNINGDEAENINPTQQLGRNTFGVEGSEETTTGKLLLLLIISDWIGFKLVEGRDLLAWLCLELLCILRPSTPQIVFD